MKTPTSSSILERPPANQAELSLVLQAGDECPTLTLAQTEAGMILGTAQ